ncbi:MAG: tail fiber domain-containing protein [Ignavibacteriales bacterium]|nr:tail fiber domain-containing protein [Ignavibacteriales bacterium]
MKTTKIFLIFSLSAIAITYSFAQENKVIIPDSSNTALDINSIQAEQGDIKFTDGTNELLRITDEGSFGAIELKSGVPSTTTNKLYNDSGSLMFDGSSLGSGASSINDLSDAKYNSTTKNLFLGFDAGKMVTTGGYNLGVGAETLKNNTSGLANTALGDNALSNNVAGESNVAIGTAALFYNSSAGSNIGIGNLANYYNQSGSQNVMIGYNAGLGSSLHSKFRNVFMGYRSGFLAEGNGNIFIGNEAGYNETGDNKLYIENSASSSPLIYGDFTIGSELVKINGDFFVSGNLNAQGNNNNGLGLNALAFNTTGDNNIAIGQGALYQNTLGSANIAIGFQANHLNEEGNNNTIIGYQAGRGSAIHDKTGNIFLGYQAGYFETGSNKLYIENSTSSSPLIWGDFTANRVVINGNSLNNSNNRTFFSNGSAGGTTAWFNDSDERLKQNILTISSALEKVKKLRGVNYEWKDKERYSKGVQMGFIAQEVEKVIPELVENTNDHYSMQYAPVTALLVEALKEQQKTIEELKKQNSEVINQISEVRQENFELQKRFAKIKKSLDSKKMAIANN